MSDYAPDSGPSAEAPRRLPRPPLGLVRPKEDAKVAGVCAAVGRATRSDPLLWRVLFAVLILFAGAGLIVYALLWLFTPTEGDTASPIEALFGRGRSSTSPPITLALTVGVGVAAFVVFWDNFPIAVGVGIALILGVVYLVRTEPQRAARQAMYGQQQQPYAPPMFTAPGYSVPPTSSNVPPAPGYRAPFAPYGPYAAYTTQSPVRGEAPGKRRPSGGPPPFMPPLATPPRYGPPPNGPVYAPPRATPPPPPQQQAPRAAKPRRPRSKLPWVVLSTIAVVMGVMGMIDAGGASIPFGWYVTAALTICAVGLLIGTWIGRARSLIALGIVLSLVLMSYTAVSWAAGRYGDVAKRDWAPTTVAEIQHSYNYDTLDGNLDLTNVPFTDADDIRIEINVGAGEFRVILPPNVDATVTAEVLGSLKLFGDENGGVVEGRYTNLGADGTGGGHITIDAHLDFGELEIRR